MANLEESTITERKKLLLEKILIIPELKTFFEFCSSKDFDINLSTSLLKKLAQLSLNPQTILALILYVICQKEEDLTKKLKIFFECKNNEIFLDGVNLYRRLIKVTQFNERPKNKKQIELTLRMFLTVLSDVQLLTVFLVLQLQKLEDIDSIYSKQNEDKAWVALNIYAPLAGRLGIFWIKSELEDCAFRHLEYENYQDLKKKIARKQSSRSESVHKIISKIKTILKKAGIEHEVYGRYKRFYSIFQKLEKVENDFERIQDLIAFRIVVNKVDDCYAALSFIHETWTPLKKRFKDYIVKPKSNGYQSLHTTVTDVFENSFDHSKPIEIQIRTHKMHRIAEYGVAAHWIYKEKQKNIKKNDSVKIEKTLQEKNNSKNFNETIPIIDLFSENIYVMTPTKEIRELPNDATPIDFAYVIHTDVGNKTTGVKVNGNIIRLDGELKSGDVLEVLTSPRQEPKKEWLEFANTRHARSKIKHALHEQNRDDSRKKGLVILEKEFRDHGLNLNRLIREGKMEHLSRHHKNQEFEHLLFCIGEGTIRIEEVLSWFLKNQKTFFEINSQEEKKIVKKESSPKVKKTIYSSSSNLILVDGLKNVMTRIARCCSPSKKQRIKGYITKEKIVTVHREMCPFLKKLKPERIIEVNWL